MLRTGQEDVLCQACDKPAVDVHTLFYSNPLGGRVKRWSPPVRPSVRPFCTPTLDSSRFQMFPSTFS